VSVDTVVRSVLDKRPCSIDAEHPFSTCKCDNQAMRLPKEGWTGSANEGE
jgi:hypothetical protein